MTRFSEELPGAVAVEGGGGGGDWCLKWYNSLARWC